MTPPRSVEELIQTKWPTYRKGSWIIQVTRKEIAEFARAYAAEQVTRALNLPNDPAQSLAAMLAKMDDQDKQAFNFCIRRRSPRRGRRSGRRV